MSDADERRKRLAAALRENLKRRKAQDRGRRPPADKGGEAPRPGPGPDEKPS